MAPVSVARYAYDGVEEMDGKLYFVGGEAEPPISTSLRGIIHQ